MLTLKARNEAEKRRFEAIIEDKGTIPTQRLKFSYESHKGRRFDLPKRYTDYMTPFLSTQAGLHILGWLLSCI